MFDQQQFAEIMSAALGFMAPRTLDDVKLSQLVLWGLRSLTTIDPRLTPELRGTGASATLVLSGAGGRELIACPAPAEADTAAWGAAIASLVRAGWDSSETVRRAGGPGLVKAFFDELFNHLDPYSRYTPPATAASDRIRRAGRAGVGITLAARAGGFSVAAVQAGSPASAAGIKPGDRLLAVDGEPTQGADQQAVTALLAGPENTQVELTLRGRDDKLRTLELERSRVPPETVQAQRFGDFLLLHVTGFSRTTASRVAQELIRALGESKPPQGIMIDLRGNRGGILQQAVTAAAMMQETGIIAVTAGRDPDANHSFVGDGHDLARGLPIAILVDGATASAAEILAAGLADQGRAVVVGSATLGKGLVQTIAELPDGGELLVSWSRVLAPDGWPIQGLGVLPQLCTSLGADLLARQIAALQSGRAPMADALARHHAARAPVPPAEALEIRAACPAAEGREADLVAARTLLESPVAYATALLPPPQRLTPAPAPSN